MKKYKNFIALMNTISDDWNFKKNNSELSSQADFFQHQKYGFTRLSHTWRLYVYICFIYVWIIKFKAEYLYWFLWINKKAVLRQFYILYVWTAADLSDDLFEHPGDLSDDLFEHPGVWLLIDRKYKIENIAEKVNCALFKGSKDQSYQNSLSKKLT